jgi:hypothetical protein
MQSFMELRSISKTFPGVRALDNTSFDLYRADSGDILRGAPFICNKDNVDKFDF